MTHIRTQWEIFRQIVREECDDVYDLLQLLKDKGDYLRNIESKFTDRMYEEMTKYMLEKLHGIGNPTKEDLMNEFVFWTEKNRGYPLGMGELGDVEEWASSWADDNGYGFLFRDED